MFSIKNMSGTLIGCIFGIFVLVSLVTLLFVCVGRGDVDGNKVAGGGRAGRPPPPLIPISPLRRYASRPSTQDDNNKHYTQQFNHITASLISRVKEYYEGTDFAAHNPAGIIMTAFSAANNDYALSLAYIHPDSVWISVEEEKEKIDKSLRRSRNNLYTVQRLLGILFSADDQLIPLNVLEVLVRDRDLCEFNDEELTDAVGVIDSVLN